MTLVAALPQGPMFTGLFQSSQICGVPLWVPVVLIPPAKLPACRPAMYVSAGPLSSSGSMATMAAAMLTRAMPATHSVPSQSWNQALAAGTSSASMFLPPVAQQIPYYCMISTAATHARQHEQAQTASAASGYCSGNWGQHATGHMKFMMHGSAVEQIRPRYEGQGSFPPAQQLLSENQHNRGAPGMISPPAPLDSSSNSLTPRTTFELDHDDIEYQRVLGMEPLRLTGAADSQCTKPFLGTVGLLDKFGPRASSSDGPLLRLVQSLSNQSNSGTTPNTLRSVEGSTLGKKQGSITSPSSWFGSGGEALNFGPSFGADGRSPDYVQQRLDEQTFGCIPEGDEYSYDSDQSFTLDASAEQSPCESASDCPNNASVDRMAPSSDDRLDPWPHRAIRSFDETRGSNYLLHLDSAKSQESKHHLRGSDTESEWPRRLSFASTNSTLSACENNVFSNSEAEGFQFEQTGGTQFQGSDIAHPWKLRGAFSWHAW